VRGEAAAPARARFGGLVPTARLVALAFVGAAPAFLFALSPAFLWLAMGFDLVLGALALLDRQLALRVQVEARRHPRGRVLVGVENRVVVRLKNLGGTRLRLSVKDEPPPEFEVEGARFDLALAAHGQEERSYRARPLKRGKFAFGDLHLRARGPLGLSAVQAAVPAPLTVRVYPDLRGASRLLLSSAAHDLANLGLRRIRRDGAGSEFARLRDYVQGDPLRDVDWKATARRARPVTRVHETERSQTVILCVDAGRTMAAKVDELTKLDYAVNAALFLAFVAIRNGDRVGVTVFADGVRAFLPPEAGRHQYRRIVDVLYSAQAALTFVDYQALFREISSRARKRSLVAVFTDLLDDEQARSLVAPLHRLARRHVPLCIALRDQALEDLVQGRPEEVDEVYRQAVGLELLEEREQLKGLIARDGVQLVDAAPRELTMAAVNRYLEVKRRGLL
jgi:uncharacterized protein (DUF58 family)